jgi:hypothetical protein
VFSGEANNNELLTVVVHFSVARHLGSSLLKYLKYFNDKKFASKEELHFPLIYVGFNTYEPLMTRVDKLCGFFFCGIINATSLCAS